MTNGEGVPGDEGNLDPTGEGTREPAEKQTGVQPGDSGRGDRE